VSTDIMDRMRDAPTCFRPPRGRGWGRAVRLVCVVTAVLALVITGFAVDDPPPAYAGPAESESFWVVDRSAGAYVTVRATARYAGGHVVVYVDDAVWLSDHLVDVLGTAFDTAVYPALVEAYGSEPDPGIDGDPRVAILVYDFNDYAVDGLFDPRDMDPGGFSYSNRREMFYLNAQAVQAEPGNAPALAAHEFAHLLLHYRDVMLDPSSGRTPEPTWLAEGFTTYAEHLAGYDGRVGGQLLAFANEPQVGLMDWSAGTRADYGASYSFVRYLVEREGTGFIRALVEQPLDGVAGIDATLVARGSSDTFASLFDDWAVACFLSGRPPEVRPYSFGDVSVSARPVMLTGPQPLPGTAEVRAYGACYLDFPASSVEATFQAVIDGSDGTPLRSALLSWDSTGAATPVVTPFDLASTAAGDTVTAAPGYDRHTLAVWAQGTVGSSSVYSFRYSGAADPPGGVQFLDMGGSDPFYEYVAVLLARGVVNGKEIPGGSGLWFFAGREDVTRAQFAKIIMEATNLHTEEIDDPGDPAFRDVPAVYDESGYPYDYVQEAAALGIVNGYAGGTFDPYRAITRAQLVLMITRGAAAAGKPLPAYTGSGKVFADVSVSDPYYRQIMSAHAAGILSGSAGSDGRLYFRPYSPATRNHVAKMTAQLIVHLEE